MRGGLETFILTLYRNVDKTKYHFNFITYDSEISYEEELVNDGCMIYKLPGRSKGIQRYRKAIDYVFKQGEYDVFWSNRTNLSSIYPFESARKHSVPVIICHSHSSKNMGTLFTLIMHKLNCRRIRKYVTHKVACSEVAARWFFGQDTDVSILKNSVDTNVYDYNKAKSDRTKRDNQMEDCFVIGHIGRFSTEKNHVFLIDIFQRIMKKENKARLVLCGDGEKKKEIEELVREKGLSNYVEFLGIRKDIIDILHLYDILVFPSLFEGLPFVLVEAQAAGLPCVVSDQVSGESKLTDTFEFLSLEAGAEYWSEQIMKYKDFERKSNKQQIEEAGFSVNNLMRQVNELLQE